MNSIKAILDKSDYEVHDAFLNYQVDGSWLDERLEELYPGRMLKGTIPTLLFMMAVDEESEVVWNRILPNEGERTVCPILMCPDDADFSCTLVDAEIERTGSTIKWNRLGLDISDEMEPEKIGSAVDWLDLVEPLEFDLGEYKQMLEKFKKQFNLDKHNWEELNGKTDQ